MIANHRLALVVAANPTGEFPNNLQALSSTSPGIKDVKVCQNTFSGDWNSYPTSIHHPCPFGLELLQGWSQGSWIRFSPETLHQGLEASLFPSTLGLIWFHALKNSREIRTGLALIFLEWSCPSWEQSCSSSATNTSLDCGDPSISALFINLKAGFFLQNVSTNIATEYQL